MFKNNYFKTRKYKSVILSNFLKYYYSAQTFNLSVLGFFYKKKHNLVFSGFKRENKD